MAQPSQDNAICNSVELLKDNRFDRFAEVVSVLMNATTVAEQSLTDSLSSSNM